MINAGSDDIEPTSGLVIQNRKPRAPYGTQLMGHVVKTWLWFFQWQYTRNLMKEQTPFVPEQMEFPNISLLAIEFNRSCWGKLILSILLLGCILMQSTQLSISPLMRQLYAMFRDNKGPTAHPKPARHLRNVSRENIFCAIGDET